MKTKTYWTIFSIADLKNMLAVAEELQKGNADALGTDADCAVYGFECAVDDYQLSLDSVRSVGSTRHHLPANLMPIGQEPRLMNYRGELFTNVNHIP